MDETMAAQGSAGGVVEVGLPEGAVIATGLGSVPLGGESAAPGGVAIYGGAGLTTYMSADGWLYVPYCGERPGSVFGTHCFKVGPGGEVVWVELPAFTEGRPGVSLEPNGLFLSWPNPQGTRVIRVQVPGFVTPGFPTSGATAPAPLPTPPPPASAAPLVDSTARSSVDALKRSLTKTIDALAARVTALESRPASTTSVDQIRDVIWNLPTVVDRIFAELQSDRGGLVAQVERIARRAVGP